MKLFSCDHCGNTIYFENVVCEQCGHRLGYAPEAHAMVSLEPENGAWRAPYLPGKLYVLCANEAHGACNWLVAHDPGGDPYCRACRHNDIVPPLDNPENVRRFQGIERAKKRLMYSLLRLRLPLATRAQDPEHGLGFRFLDEAAAAEPVMTGHDAGIITIALAEADDAQREYRRTQLNEQYRTLLGHFRHEIAHHYWDILIAPGPHLEEFRRRFGDETVDYEEALQRHYARGAPPDWPASFISSYATSHPWEDFAESFAHYVHLVDTAEVASSFGLRLAPKVDPRGALDTRIDFDPYDLDSLDPLVDSWAPLSALINSLNRAVGHRDAYPFVLTELVIEKLKFIHRVIREAGRAQWTVPGPNGEAVPINTPAG
jgi:hypothetical protein